MRVQERTTKKTEGGDGGAVHLHFSGETEEGFAFSIKVPKAVAEEALRAKVTAAMAAKMPGLTKAIEDHFREAENDLDEVKNHALDALGAIREEMGLPEK